MRAKSGLAALRGRLRGLPAAAAERQATPTPQRLLHLAVLLGVGAVCALAWQMSGVHTHGNASSSSPLVRAPRAGQSRANPKLTRWAFFRSSKVQRSAQCSQSLSRNHLRLTPF
jgi:hypothetical protein